MNGGTCCCVMHGTLQDSSRCPIHHGEGFTSEASPAPQPEPTIHVYAEQAGHYSTTVGHMIAAPPAGAREISPIGASIIDHPEMKRWEKQGYAQQRENGLWLHYSAICTLLRGERARADAAERLLCKVTDKLKEVRAEVDSHRSELRQAQAKLKIKEEIEGKQLPCGHLFRHLIFKADGSDTGCSICTLLRSEAELRQAQAWKASMIAVSPPLQEIGQELNVKLGDSIQDKILPGIVELKRQVRDMREALALAVDQASPCECDNNGHCGYCVGAAALLSRKEDKAQ